jgi:hypothetical protein
MKKEDNKMNPTKAKPVFIEIRELLDYLRWHDLNCTKSATELCNSLSEEFNAIVSLRNLVMASVLSGYSVIPGRGPTRYISFCKVADTN